MSTLPDLSNPDFLKFVTERATPEQRKKFAPFLAAEIAAANYDWTRQARPEQLEPEGDWIIWLLVTGRRWGKTRSAAEWLRKRALSEVGSYAICAPTYGDVRDVCVEGGQAEPANRRSGLISVCAPGEIEAYNRSLGEIRMRNGSKIKMLSADEPDRARGWGFNAAWCDEFSSWRRPATWYETLLPAVTMSDTHRFMITTTPKPNALSKALILRSATDPSIAFTRGATKDNEKNLGKGAVAELRSQMTERTARQELEGELLLDTPGALWLYDTIEQGRVLAAPMANRRVLAIDPSDGEEKGDGFGVTVASLGMNGHGYVEYCDEWKESPAKMAEMVVQLAYDMECSTVVVEKNHGGKWIPALLHTIDRHLKVKTVWAADGKITRAEPVAALFETTDEKQATAHIVGNMPELQDEMTSYTGKPGELSPDRLDSMVWALTELMLQGPRPQLIYRGR